MDLQKVAADSKRIAEKMQATQLLAEESKLQNKSPSSSSAPGKQSNNDPENGRVLCGWREDEDDRFNVGDYLFTSYRQNPYCDQHPEKLHAIMKALFLADHDAAQLEQYELENGTRQQIAIQKPAMTLKQALYRGLRAGLVLIIILSGQSVRVQAQAEIKALKIGDKVPDITIQNIINYSSTSAKISDFKGKLLILYSWSTTCHASVNLLPHIAGLQKAFPGKVQIIAVGKEDGATVKRQASLKGMGGLAFMPSDSLLLKLFPHELVPQLVWISPESRVLGMTTDYDATPATIANILKGDKVVFKDPKADQIGFDWDKPLFLDGNGSTASYLFRSILTPYSNGLAGGVGRRADSSQVRIRAINQGRLQLYILALRLPQFFWSASRIAYEGVDVSKFTFTNWVEEKFQKAYCYELILPSMFDDQANAIMLHDLQKLFGATAGLEKRTVPCYVLKVVNPKLIPPSTGGQGRHNLDDTTAKEKWMRGMPLSQLARYLQELPGHLPVVDETGHCKNVDLKLNGNLRDLPALNKTLSKYGLQLQRTERTLDILVISPIDVPGSITHTN